MNNRIISDITDYIFVSEEPKKVDAIFLPGGSYPELPEYAAQLYKNKFADIIIPSGAYSIKIGKFAGVKSKIDIYNKDYKKECEFYTDVLIKNGVPISVLYPENLAVCTVENAKFTREVADKYKLDIKKAIIVCKSFHARRCLMLYQLSFPDTEITVCPVDSSITRENWFTFEHGIDRVLGELERCGRQFIGEIKEYLKCESLK